MFHSTEMDEKKRVHLFNCDNTYDLPVVEALIRAIEEKLHFKITVSKHYFSLQNMSEICENTISKLHMDFAFLVVHADESRLSINENNVDIGYTKVYRELLKATGEKVIVVIGGDSHYKNEAEENNDVLSRWAFRIVNLQFKEEFRDGRKSFVFSWNEKHRAIHEEALLHFFDPNKAGVKFVRRLEMSAQPKSDAPTAYGSTPESVFVENTLAALDVHDGRQQVEARRRAKQHGKTGTVDLMILCSDESAATAVSNMYCLPIMRHPPKVHIGSPSELKLHLAGKPVTVCAIGLLASDLKETALKSKWQDSDFADLLKTARTAAENKVIVVMSVDRNVKKLALTQSEEIQINEKIELILEEKGVILWWRGRIQESAPRDIGAAALPARQQGRQPSTEQKEDPQTDNPKKTLMLKTSIRFGVISYKEYDVKAMKEGWVPPPQLVSDLRDRWKNVPSVELEIYAEKDSGDLRAVVQNSPGSWMRSYKQAVQQIINPFMK